MTHLGVALLLLLLQSRLYALNQVLELLSTAQEKEEMTGQRGFRSPGPSTSPSFTSTTLLNSAHLQLVAGCFGVGLTPDLQEMGPRSLLHHYQVSTSSHYSLLLVIILKIENEN